MDKGHTTAHDEPIINDDLTDEQQYICELVAEAHWCNLLLEEKRLYA